MDRLGERTAMIHLTLLTRDGCRLCDEMKEVVGQCVRVSGLVSNQSSLPSMVHPVPVVAVVAVVAEMNR